LFPAFNEFFVFLHDVVIVKDCEAKTILEHFGLEVLQHHVSKLQFFVSGHVLAVRDLAVESHDWAESITFRDQSQFSRREVVVFAVTVHLNFLNRLQRFFLKVVD